MAYRRLSSLLESAKPIVDFARAITTVFALSAICAVVAVNLWNNPSRTPYLNYAAWSAAILLGIVTVNLMGICARLWWGLLMDWFMPDLPEDTPISKARWAGMIFLGVAAVVIHFGTAALVGAAAVAAVTHSP